MPTRLPIPTFELPDYAIIEGTEAAVAHCDSPPGALDISVPVAENVVVDCRLYAGNPSWPSILYFHGNGETVDDYDPIAPLFLRSGINFFIAGYRGYGRSTGNLSFRSMLSDAHTLLAAFEKSLDDQGFAAPRFVMGRSLGAHSAVELAAYYPNSLRGLILSSGVPRPQLALALPTLMIHGDQDESYESAQRFFATLTMDDKVFETVVGAGHNDIFNLASRQYFEAIQTFVKVHSKSPSKKT